MPRKQRCVSTVMIQSTNTRVLIKITTVLKERSLDISVPTVPVGDTCGYVRDTKMKIKKLWKDSKQNIRRTTSWSLV